MHDFVSRKGFVKKTVALTKTNERPVRWRLNTCTQMQSRALVIIAACFSLLSCGNLSTVFRTGDVKASGFVITDATQRVIVASPSRYEVLTARNNPDYILCAEPSPDVAPAITTALSASLKTGASLSAQASDNIVQLGTRLATIQLLRDELSDLCRSYSNGAVSTTTYTIRLSKLDRKMVTLLATEASENKSSTVDPGLHTNSGSSNSEKNNTKAPAANGNPTDDSAKAAADLLAGTKLSSVKSEEESQPAHTGSVSALNAAEKKVSSDVSALKHLTAKVEADLVTVSKASAKTLDAARTALTNDFAAEQKAISTLQADETSALKLELASESPNGAPPEPTRAPTDSQTGSKATPASAVSIQQQFLESSELPTLLDACITTLDTETRRTPEDKEVYQKASDAWSSANNKVATTQSQLSTAFQELRNSEDDDGRILDQDKYNSWKTASDAFQSAQSDLSAASRALQQSGLASNASSFATYCSDSLGTMVSTIRIIEAEKIRLKRLQVLTDSGFVDFCKTAFTSSNPNTADTRKVSSGGKSSNSQPKAASASKPSGPTSSSSTGMTSTYTGNQDAQSVAIRMCEDVFEDDLGGSASGESYASGYGSSNAFSSAFPSTKIPSKASPQIHTP